MAKQQSKKWFIERHSLAITSSVASTILGRGLGSLSEIFQEKVNEYRKSNLTNESIQFGTHMEPYARMAYSKKFNVDIIECPLQKSRLYPYIGVSPDGQEPVTKSLLELKCVTTRLLKDEMPKYNYDQCQTQLLVCEDAPFLDYFEVQIIAVNEYPKTYELWRKIDDNGTKYVISDYRHHRIYRDKEWKRKALPMFEAFYQDIQLLKRLKRRKRSFYKKTLSSILNGNDKWSLCYGDNLFIYSDAIARVVSGQEASVLSTSMTMCQISKWVHFRKVKLINKILKNHSYVSPPFFIFGNPTPINAFETKKLIKKSPNIIVGGTWTYKHKNYYIYSNPWVVVHGTKMKNLFNLQGLDCYYIVHFCAGWIDVNKNRKLRDTNKWRYMKSYLSVCSAVLKSNKLDMGAYAILVSENITVTVSVNDMDLKKHVEKYLHIKQLSQGSKEFWKLKGWKHACQNNSDLKKLIIKNQHVSILPKITESKLQQLYSRNILTLKDIKIFPWTSKTTKNWTSYINFHIRSNKNLHVTNMKLLKDSLKVNNNEIPFYVDIESFPSMDGQQNTWVFLIGVLSKTYTPLTLRSCSDRSHRHIIKNFFRLLSNKKKKVKVFHWGHVDRTSIYRICKDDNKLKEKFEKIIWVDICDVLRRSETFIRNAYNYKLKDVSQAMGLHEYNSLYCSNGLDAMIRAWSLYQESLSRDNPIFKKIIEYNRVDCEMLKNIRCKILTACN